MLLWISHFPSKPQFPFVDKLAGGCADEVRKSAHMKYLAHAGEDVNSACVLNSYHHAHCWLYRILNTAALSSSLCLHAKSLSVLSWECPGAWAQAYWITGCSSTCPLSACRRVRSRLEEMFSHMHNLICTMVMGARRRALKRGREGEIRWGLA